MDSRRRDRTAQVSQNAGLNLIGIYLISQGHPHPFQLSWAFEAALDIRRLPIGVKVSRRSAFPQRGYVFSPESVAPQLSSCSCSIFERWLRSVHFYADNRCMSKPRSTIKERARGRARARARGRLGTYLHRAKHEPPPGENRDMFSQRAWAVAGHGVYGVSNFLTNL